jgi:hypothetical protein
MLFQVPSQITKVSTMVDGGLKVEVVTQEVNAEEKAKLFSLHKSIGWFLFKEREVTPEDVVDIPDYKPEFKGDKSPSKRLRDVLYVDWKQNVQVGDADGYYKQEMERFIEQVKDRLI